MTSLHYSVDYNRVRTLSCTVPTPRSTGGKDGAVNAQQQPLFSYGLLPSRQYRLSLLPRNCCPHPRPGRREEKGAATPSSPIPSPCCQSLPPHEAPGTAGWHARGLGRPRSGSQAGQDQQGLAAGPTELLATAAPLPQQTHTPQGKIHCP